ncbi:hypothetical protein ASD75_04700 [Acidovorax sp. Root568]|nr:hypothetical protein ASD75_04700 [Acidovorax sp. Root568]
MPKLKIELLELLLGRIVVAPAITEETLIRDLINVLKINGFTIDENAIQRQSAKICLCTMMHMHNTQYKIDTGFIATCEISSEQAQQEITTKNSHELMNFGKLCVKAAFPAFQDRPTNVKFAFDILKTNTEAIEFSTLGLIKPLEIKEMPGVEYVVFQPGPTLILREDFMLEEHVE